MRTWSLGLDDDVDNVWRNLVVTKVSPDTLHVFKTCFGLNGCVVPNKVCVNTSSITMKIRGFLISRLDNRENHTSVCLIGTIFVMVARSSTIFLKHLVIRQKGGKANASVSIAQSSVKASIYLAAGSTCQET